MKIKKILASIVIAAVITSNIPYFGISHDNIAYADGGGDVSLSGDTLSISKGSDKIELQICSSKIVKVNYKPNGEEDPETLVLDPNKKWKSGNIKSSDVKSNPAIIKTDDMTVKIDTSALTMEVLNSEGTSLLQKVPLEAKNKEISFPHSGTQDFYGVSGYSHNQNTEDGTLRNEKHEITCDSQGYVGGPFAWTPSGYGVLVDTDGGKYNVENNTVEFSDLSKKNTEYFIMVGNPTEVLESEAEISGKAPMYPKWAMGFTNTQWGWKSGSTAEDQFKAAIEKYRADGYPIDNFCFDFDWKQWGQLDKDCGEFKWNTDNFPGAKDTSLKEWAESKGIHMTGIMKPRLFLDTSEAKTMEEKGWWYSDRKENDYCAGKSVRICDFSNPDLRKWWWDQVQDSFDKGISGFWNDECDKENGFRNFDNLNMQRSIYEGQRAYTKDKTRVWSINRNFYTGAQRYGYGAWSGDINSDFQAMKAQTNRLIAAVNIGEAKWGMDTGGFSGDPGSENYARWIEFSAFTPIFRVHGQKIPDHKERYPWNYGETAAAAAKDAMHLRYQLIPYIYKYDHQASESGVGLVKSMMMAYPNDAKSRGNVSEWMFGDYMLVSPVLDQNQETKNIYLPQGNWIDYSTGEKYVGGKEVEHKVDTKEWKDVPVFIKQGAIIPSQDYEDYVGQKKMENIYVDVFPDSKETSFDYYDDDGNSYDYENGNYFKQKLSVARNDDWSDVEFKTGPKEGDYTPDVNSYIVKLHVKSKGAVTANKKELKKYDSLDALKAAGADSEGYASGTDKYGDVVYVKIKSGDVQTVDAPCDFAAGPEETSNIYVENAKDSSKLEYSADSGKTWVDNKELKPSGCLGCVGSTVKCSLKSNSLKVRINNGGDYFPSEDGVSLTASNGNFMIDKDGKVSEMASMNSTKLYIMSNNDDSNIPVLVQYKDGSKWSDSISLEPYGTNDGQYFKELLYSQDKSDLTIRYSDDNGKTWKPSDDGTKLQSGEYQSSDDGSLKEGKPDWQNTVTVYYKATYPKAYIHYHADGGDWTNSPGQEMQACTNFPGYFKAVLSVGSGSFVEGCFNNGSDKWDNNDDKNYKIEKGVYTVNGTKITAGDPNGKHAGNSKPDTKEDDNSLTVSCNIKGDTYNSAQEIKLSSSDDKATIYYTTDGNEPTEKGTKYTSPIEVKETTTIKFIAIDSKGNKSPINTQKYTIDKNADPENKDPEKKDPENKDPEKKDPEKKDPENKEYDKLKTVNFKISSSSVKKGENVTLTASCNTDDPSVKYSFGYYDNNDKWQEIKGDSSSNTYKWETDVTGDIELAVKAKSDDVDEIESDKEELTINDKGQENPTKDKLTKVTLKASDTNITVGKSVKLTASVDYDDDSIQYEFGYYDSCNKWCKIYSGSKSTYDWTVQDQGTYEVKVKAVSKDSNESCSSNSVKITAESKGSNNDPENSFDNNNMIAIFIILAASGLVIMLERRKGRIMK